MSRYKILALTPLNPRTLVERWNIRVEVEHERCGAPKRVKTGAKQNDKLLDFAILVIGLVNFVSAT